MADTGGTSHGNRDNLPIYVTAGLGLLLSLAACYLVWHWEDRGAKQEFNAIADNDVPTLQNGLDEYLNKLVAFQNGQFRCQR
jgi:CHASE1-domain containing sensor protein